MTTQNRKTLKDYFKAGARPTAKEFADLIDSSLIMLDEGFEKTPQDGLRIITLGGFNQLISFAPQSLGRPTWSVGFADGTGERLAVAPAGLSGASPPSLTFARSAYPHPQPSPAADPGAPPVDAAAFVGVGTAEPQTQLDVRGVVRSHGRRGREVQAPADGKFHALIAGLHGCHAFEVMAGVGSPGESRFALVHAIAMNTFNPSWWQNPFLLKKRIRHQHAYYGQRSDRLELRWIPEARRTDIKTPNQAAPMYGKEAVYSLQIRTRSSYADPAAQVPKPQITAFITNLWFDDQMSSKSS